MSNRTIRIKTRPFDMANHLGSEAEITEYLRQALEDGDPAELAAALGDIARARGMTQLARDTGLLRESLYERPVGRTRAQQRDAVQSHPRHGVQAVLAGPALRRVFRRGPARLPNACGDEQSTVAASVSRKVTA